jgi:integrase
MSKRGNAEGSIYRRKDGRWVASYIDARGKRRYQYARTRQEAATKLTAALKGRQDGIPEPSGSLTVAAYLDLWLDAVEPSVRYSTWKRYEQLTRSHISPTLGRLRLTRLEPHHIQKLYGEKLEGWSPTTVAHMHRVLHRAIDQAMKWGYVSRNVASLVTPPRPRRREMKILTVKEAKALFKEAKGTRFEALYCVALTVGLRQGELLGLRWQDIDLDQKRLEVRRALIVGKDGPTFAEPKTSKSRRRIKLTAFAVESLKKHRASQAEERLKLGEAWTDMDLVFPNEVGKPVEPSNLIRRSFKPLLKVAKLPTIRFHDLRHTCASHLLAANIHPKVVSEILGHASIAITLDVYSHILPDMQNEAAEMMESLLGS